MVIIALDFQGNIVSVVQIIALALLIVGVYPLEIRTKNRNLIMHGFLSILALALNLATVFLVMIPTFNNNLAIIRGLPIIQLAAVWFHTVFGITAIALGFVIIGFWVIHLLGELICSKMWKLMLPAFLVWAFALILGLSIHFFNIV